MKDSAGYWLEQNQKGHASSANAQGRSKEPVIEVKVDAEQNRRRKPVKKEKRSKLVEVIVCVQQNQ